MYEHFNVYISRCRSQVNNQYALGTLCHTFMTSMKNVKFLHPSPPFSVFPNGSELGRNPLPLDVET